MFDYLNYKNKIPLEKCLVEIPRINPLSSQYEKFWIHNIKRKQIEGMWVEHNEEYKWIPGSIFQYVNLWNIEMKKTGSTSKGKVIGKPRLRDLEWIKGYVHAAARGFSGFADDDNYSCNRLLIAEDRDFIVDLKPKKVQQSLYKSDGTFKEYVPALEYLYKYYDKNLGKPLFYNEAKNVPDVEARNLGKSFISANFCAHNFLTDGVMDFDEWLENRNKQPDKRETYTTQTLIGAIDSKYSNGLASKIKLGLDFLPGKIEIGDLVYPAPLSKKYSGSWMCGKNIVASYEEKVGGKWETKGSGSGFLHRSFSDNPFAANGSRYGFGIIDEVGFMYNLEETLGQLHECTTVDGEKYGTVWMCVCENTKVWTKDGRLINIQDLVSEDGIIGWDERTKSSSPTDIVRMFPPSKKECYRITTNAGRTLECSYDHPILWSNKSFGSRPRSKDNLCNRKFIKKTIFKETKDIKVGDQLAIAESVEVFGNNTIWQPRFVGMLIGDGSYGFDKTPVFSNCDEELNNYIDSRFNTKIEKSYITKDGRVYRETRIKDICPELRKLNIYGQTKLAKRLPSIITTCDKLTICELLGGFFDTDGYVCVDKNNVSQIGLTASSKDLLEEVRMLLQKLGIHASINKRLPRKENRLDKNPYYNLSISDKRSLLLFEKNIKLLIKYKQENLVKIKNLCENSPIRQSESIKGLRFERVVSIENIGVKTVYNITAAGHNTYMANGIVTHNTGTGGDMDGGATEAVKRVFYNPEAYECLEFDDIFENSGKKIGFFIPGWMAFDEFRDEFGNVNKELGIKKLNIERDKARQAKSKKPLNDLMQMKPLVPSEAFLISGGSIFEALIPDLKEQLAFVETSSDGDVKGTTGELVINSAGTVEFKPNFNLRACDYPVTDKGEKDGAVVIWEQPSKDIEYGWYISGLDPYNQDEAENSVSLGSLFILKRRNIKAKQSHDQIVAEYTGRPSSHKEFYENCRRLLMYYSALCLYENNFNGFKTFLETKHSLHLLAYTPTILKNNKNTTVSRTYGQNMSKNVKDELEIYTRDWLGETVGDGKLNLHFIYSKGLLKELISYNSTGNYDRVISLMLCVAQAIQMHNLIVEKKEDKPKVDAFFMRKMFVNR